MISRHRFCRVTHTCKRCGLTVDEWFARHAEPVFCYNPRAPVTSLDWWRRLRAHERLREQLTESVRIALD